MTGCGKTLTLADFDAIHRYAAKELPWTVSLEEKYPHTDHFISYFGMNNYSPVWNSVAYFGDRYELTIQIDIQIDYKRNEFRSVGPVAAFLHEVGQVRNDGSNSFASDIHLSEEQFELLSKSNWDFNSIGITLNPTPVKNFDVFERGWREPRRSVSLIN